MTVNCNTTNLQDIAQYSFMVKCTCFKCFKHQFQSFGIRFDDGFPWLALYQSVTSKALTPFHWWCYPASKCVIRQKKKKRIREINALLFEI
jgi:hypothetical protein